MSTDLNDVVGISKNENYTSAKVFLRLIWLEAKKNQAFLLGYLGVMALTFYVFVKQILQQPLFAINMTGSPYAGFIAVWVMVFGIGIALLPIMIFRSANSDQSFLYVSAPSGLAHVTARLTFFGGIFTLFIVIMGLMMRTAFGHNAEHVVVFPGVSFLSLIAYFLLCVCLPFVASLLWLEIFSDAFQLYKRKGFAIGFVLLWGSVLNIWGLLVVKLFQKLPQFWHIPTLSSKAEFSWASIDGFGLRFLPTEPLLFGVLFMVGFIFLAGKQFEEVEA